MTSGADGQDGRSAFQARGYTIDDNTLVLELRGECDLAVQASLRSALLAALDTEPQTLVVDLSHVTFCDIACARELFTAASRVRLTLAGQRDVVQRLFDTIDPNRRLSRHPTLTAALRPT